MSPAIRDGLGRLTVEDDTERRLRANPPGPVERVAAPTEFPRTPGIASRSLPRPVAKVEAHRPEELVAATHEALGPSGEPTPAEDGVFTPPGYDATSRYPLPKERAERDRLVLAALRKTTSVGAAARQLGVSETRVHRDIRIAGEMPADLDATIKSRAAHAAASRTGSVRLAPALTESQAPETPAPATDGLDLGTTAPPAAEEVATPPEPINLPDDIAHAREVEADMADAIFRTRIARDEARAFDHEHSRLYDALKVAEERAELAGDESIRVELRQMRRRVARHIEERTCAA